MKQSTSIDADRNNCSLEDSFGYVFRDAHRLIGRSLQDRLEGVGVSLGQWYLLCALWQEEGLTQRELSARIGMSQPSAVIALRALEDAGLLQRKVDIADSRRKLVDLTPKGRMLQVEMLRVEDEINYTIGTALSRDEQRQLLRLIKRVRRIFQPI